MRTARTEIILTTLTDHQGQAVKTVTGLLKSVSPPPFVYLAGFAGSGKSFLLPFLLDDLGYQPNSIWFCAPTGKAAKVMRQKLKAQEYPKTDTMTIHSSIYRARPAPVATLEEDLEKHQAALAQFTAEVRAEHLVELDAGRMKLAQFPEIEKQRKLILRLQADLAKLYREEDLNFQLNGDSLIANSSLIVVDEASMVGRNMTDDLLSFGVPILAIGDPGQLPPVGDDPGFTSGKPDFFLTEIHRQAEGNPIIHLATLARKGEVLPYGDYGNGVEVMRREDYNPSDLTFENRPQYIVGMNKTRWRINQMLRQDFGFVERAGEYLGPQTGEPIVIKKNNRENPNLVNGTECVVKEASEMVKGNTAFQMSFTDDEGLDYDNLRVFQGFFEEHFSKKAGKYTGPDKVAFREKRKSVCADWSYAITAHTAQGSGFKDVVVIDESGVFGEDANRHLYTSITRAEQTLKVLI